MKNTLPEESLYWFWFVNIAGIGPKTRKLLIDHFQSPVSVYEAGEVELGGFLTGKQKKSFDASRDPERVRSFYRSIRDKGIRFISMESGDYPSRLHHLYDPPYGFYLIGRLPQRDKPALAMVGSRKATPYGRRISEEYAGIFAGRGIEVISGMAAGIDAASHRGALKGGGYSLGILGGGIDSIYPRENYNLYRQMYDEGGILSEYPPGVACHRGLFPRRNRLISAFADAVFVVEAAGESGSLITADQALEQGRDVFALPGRISDRMSEGCNNLIAQGAVMVRSPADVLEYFSLPYAACKTKTAGYAGVSDPAERAVMDRLDMIEPTSFDSLLSTCGIERQKLCHTLIRMEMKGLISQAGQNRYILGR